MTGGASRARLPLLLRSADYSTDTLKHTFVPKCELEAQGIASFPALEDWIAIFRNSITYFKLVCASDTSIGDPQRAAEKFACLYEIGLQNIEKQKSIPTIVDLCRLREDCLVESGFHDPFLEIKKQENAKALQILPQVCQELDEEYSSGADRWEAIIRGIFAGNIFDLGAAHTADAYHNNDDEMSFFKTRGHLLERPWVIDEMDALLDRLTSQEKYKKVLIFVDNSGSDVILGILPFARECFRQHGATVILAANEKPSINDITAKELEQLLDGIAAADHVLCKAIASSKLQVWSSGNGLPVIDLRYVSSELNEEVFDADLVVLEGMGRSIETNLNARFTCDAVKIGMIKHPEVAAALNGRMLDCVIKFDAGDALTAI